PFEPECSGVETTVLVFRQQTRGGVVDDKEKCEGKKYECQLGRIFPLAGRYLLVMIIPVRFVTARQQQPRSTTLAIADQFWVTPAHSVTYFFPLSTKGRSN